MGAQILGISGKILTMKITGRLEHFGRREFPWEKLDAVEELRAEAKKA